MDNWECVRSTSYVEVPAPMTDAQAAFYTAQGFEIGLHVDTNCQDWTPSSLASTYTSQLSSFAAQFPGLPAPVTNRTHCIAWSDWVTQPQVEFDNGIRLDTNYYYWPPAWISDRPGYFTGSGMPMRFAALDGTMIDVYQAATQITDESGQTLPYTIDTLLDNALGPLGYYGAVTINAHTDAVYSNVSDAVVTSGLARAFRKKGVTVDVPKLIEKDEEKCTSCGACVSLCPMNALKYNPSNKVELDEAVCNGITCGLCVDACPVRAIRLLG